MDVSWKPVRILLLAENGENGGRHTSSLTVTTFELLSLLFSPQHLRRDDFISINLIPPILSTPGVLDVVLQWKSFAILAKSSSLALSQVARSRKQSNIHVATTSNLKAATA
jgi:hypothetical protein